MLQRLRAVHSQVQGTVKVPRTFTPLICQLPTNIYLSLTLSPLPPNSSHTKTGSAGWLRSAS
jgi:hypothetical protein